MKPVAVVVIGRKNVQKRTIMREKTSKACTISNIAEYAQVSRSTVSRVLNNVNTKVPVSAATRAKIDEAVRHFDYMPNANARRLSHNKSFIIGLQVPAHHLSRYVFTDYNLIGAMHGIEAALLPSDYKLLLLFQSEKYMQKSEYLALDDGVADCVQYPLKTFRSDRFALGFDGVNRRFELIDSGKPHSRRHEYLQMQVQR